MHYDDLQGVQTHNILVCNDKKSDIYGSVYTKNYPSYTRLSLWNDLSNKTFNLLGVKIIGGHNNADAATIMTVIKTLNSALDYKITTKISVTIDNEICFVVGVTKTDVFRMDSFCYALQLAGWITYPYDENVNYDDLHKYMFIVPQGFKL